MLLRSNNYDDLYSNFRWEIPKFYNIAADTIDKNEFSHRIALINFLSDGRTEIGHS